MRTVCRALESETRHDQRKTKTMAHAVDIGRYMPSRSLIEIEKSIGTRLFQ